MKKRLVQVFYDNGSTKLINLSDVEIAILVNQKNHTKIQIIG